MLNRYPTLSKNLFSTPNLSLRKLAKASNFRILSSQMHSWSHVPQAPADPILSLNETFLEDKSHKKVNLTVGAYKDDNGNPWVLPSIKMAEVARTNSQTITHEYLPINGNPQFLAYATRFAYGSDIYNSHTIAGCQTVSGSGAVRLAAEFLVRFFKSPIYIPTPTWPNHDSIFQQMNFETYKYRYWNPKALGLDFEGLISDIKNAPDNSIFVLHACAHNPTGCDPTKEQWKEIESEFKAKNHFAFFDMAYQGFATGDPDDDAWPVRYFVNQGHSVLLCQSFAKNMGLYGQRVGAMSLICNNNEEKNKCISQFKSLIRILYSSPPRYGSELATTIFKDPAIYEQWKQDITAMASRTSKMRKTLNFLLKEKGVDWSHILTQKGMFAFTGLSEHHVTKLKENFHIFMTKDGRISIPGLNSSNIDYVADSIPKVIHGA